MQSYKRLILLTSMLTWPRKILNWLEYYNFLSLNTQIWAAQRRQHLLESECPFDFNWRKEIHFYNTLFSRCTTWQCRWFFQFKKDQISLWIFTEFRVMQHIFPSAELLYTMITIKFMRCSHMDFYFTNAVKFEITPDALKGCSIIAFWSWSSMIIWIHFFLCTLFWSNFPHDWAKCGTSLSISDILKQLFLSLQV